MDFTSKCPCSHYAWEHDIGGDARGCRYCSCELSPGKAAYPLPPRTPSDFLAKPNWLRESPLFGSGLGYAGTFGAGRLGVYIMAESLGVEEERQGKPLVGPSGKLAARMVYRTLDPETNLPLSLDDDFWRGNIAPIKPPFDKLDAIPYPIRADLLGRCRPYWEADLAAKRPKAILAVGAHALRALTGRGEITRVRGAIIQTPYGPVIPTYHPAYILRGKTHLAQVWQTDLRRALYIARHGVPSTKVYYTLYPTGDDTRRFYEEWVEKGRPPIAFDIETPHSSAGKDEDQVVADGEDADLPISEDPSYKIDRISMSFAGKSAITAPWVEPHISWFKRILLEADVSWGWNSSSFDVPRLTANGAPLGPRANHVDLMLCLHGKSWLRLPDGRRMRVADAAAADVRQLIGVGVDGDLKPVNVVRWHRTPARNQTWFKIFNDSSRHPIVCTPEHLVLTGVGWKRADALVVGDVVLGPKAGSDDLIHGTLLGDGYFSKSTRSLCVVHSPKQAEWFNSKLRHLGTPTFGDYHNGPGHRRLLLQTVASRRWAVLQRPGGKHFVPPPSPAALAVWWSDDGSLGSRATKAGGRTGFRGILPIHSFDNPEEVWVWAVETFGRAGLSRYTRRDVQGFALYFTGPALRALCEAIGPFTVPSMQYKLLPESRGQYNGWLERQVPRRSQVCRIETFEERAAVRYCADVDEPTHAFATEGGLVHNCWHLLEPSLPMGLKPTSTMFFFDASADWAGKTLASSDPPLYSAMDSDFTARLGEMLTARAQREGKWEMFLRHYVLLDRILRRMTAKGVRTDREVRLAARERFLERLSSTVASLQPHIPLDIRPRKVYKKPEEALRKGGQWVEGEMVEVEVMEAPPKTWVYFYRVENGKVVVWEKRKAISADAAALEHAHPQCDCEVAIGKRPKAPLKPKKKTFVVTFRKTLKKGDVVKTRSVRALTMEEAMGSVLGALSAVEAA